MGDGGYTARDGTPGFKTELVVKELVAGEAKKWELVEDLVYEANREAFRIPAGYQTDFTTVPKTVSWLVPRYGRHTRAAVVHDYLIDDPDDLNISRCDADGIFRKIMREDLGVDYVRRRMMWAGVRWAGGIHNCGLGQALLVVLITLLAVPIIVPALVVWTSLLLFWVVQIGFWVVRRVVGLGHMPPPGPPWGW